MRGGFAQHRGHARLAQCRVATPADVGLDLAAPLGARRSPRSRPESRPRSGTAPRRSSCTGTRARRRAGRRRRGRRRSGSPPPRAPSRRCRTSRAPRWRRPRGGPCIRRSASAPKPGATARNTRRPSIRCGPRRSASRSRTLATEPSASVPILSAPMRASASAVSGPKIPSHPRPALRWNSVSAPAVSGPKIPSSLPASKPSVLRRRWSSTTSSPRSIGRRTYSIRSPRRKPLSTSAVQVSRPQMPSTRNARCSWNARSSRSVVGPKLPSSPGGIGVTERDQTPLKVPDRLAAAARPEDGRIAQPMNSARSWRSAPLPFAPTMRFAGWPSLKTSNVGMLITS